MSTSLMVIKGQRRSDVGTKGNALPEHVLKGYTFTSDNGRELQGTIKQFGEKVFPTDYDYEDHTYSDGSVERRIKVKPGAGYITSDTEIIVSELMVQDVHEITSDKLVAGKEIAGISGNINNVNTADATAANNLIVNGYTAYAKGKKLTGNIENFSGKTIWSNEENNGSIVYEDHTLSTGVTTKYLKVIPRAGYTDGTAKFIVDESSIVSAYEITADKIVSGKKILGVSGNSNNVNTADATATANLIVKGYTAYIKGKKITGAVENFSGGNIWSSESANGSWVYEEQELTNGNTIKCIKLIPRAGYTDGTAKFIVSESFVTEAYEITSDKIMNGCKIAGVSGDSYNRNTKDATANSSDVLKGKVFYSQGSRATGTIVNNSGSTQDANLTQDTSYVYLSPKSAGYFNTTSKLRIPKGNLTGKIRLIKTFSVSPGASNGSVSIADYANYQKLSSESLLICPYNIIGPDGYSIETVVTIGHISSYDPSTGIIQFNYTLTSNNNSFVTMLFAVYCVEF